MTTIAQKSDYKVTFNGSATYFVMAGDICALATQSKTRAVNKFNKITKAAGIN
jgi:hypothetical protein